MRSAGGGKEPRTCLIGIASPIYPDKSHTMGKVAIWLKSAGEQPFNSAIGGKVNWSCATNFVTCTL